MILSWSMKHTLVWCERHGWVSGKFGLSDGEGMIKEGHWWIDYCCGLKGQGIKPPSIYADFILSLALEKQKEKKKCERK